MNLLKILIVLLSISLFSCAVKEKKETSKAAISVKDDLGSGMTIINPGWTTYKPLTDYFGNTINYTTPNRGAIQ